MPRVSEEHTESRKSQILGAATRCFADKGFHGASMKDIIEESGLSAGAIYNYFPSKADIVDAIARERHSREVEVLASAVEDAGKAADLPGLARSFFLRFASAAHREERRVGVEVWAEALRNPRVLDTVRHGVDEPVRAIAAVVAACQRRDELPSELEPEGIARLMVAVFQGFVLQQAWQPNVDMDMYLRALDAVLNALANSVTEG